MRGPARRISIFTVAFAALLLVLAPHAAWAQLTQGTAVGQPAVPMATPPGDATTNNCASMGYTGTQLCMCNQQFALSRAAQDRSAAHAKVFGNANLISMKLVYCWNTISQMISRIGGITDVWGLIWNTIIMPIIMSILNQLCQSVISTIQAAIQDLKSLVCIPIPHLFLNLHFGAHGNTCNGISLLGGFNNSAVRPLVPGIWGIWGAGQQGPPVYGQ